MPKIMEPSLADTYGGVAMVSCMWIIMSYMFMPFGPIAGLKKCTAGQQKWCVFFNPHDFCTLMISQSPTFVCAGAIAPS